MKWVGIAGALLSFAGTVYGLLHAQGELRERSRIVNEQLAAGHAQQSAGDYAAAWDSLEKASAAAQVDGFFAKLLGNLSEPQRKVRTAQEDLAMEWLRETHATEGHSFAEITDKLVNTLAVSSTTASGSRKGDLLAHLGWAYFLKRRSDDFSVQPEKLYKEAVAADAGNPYANAFWGHWILWNHGSLDDANRHFRVALESHRAREDVRRFQLAALQNAEPETDGAWVSVVNEMHKANEPLAGGTLKHLYDRYYFALNNDDERARLFAAVPPAEHLELERLLLGLNQPDHKLTLDAMMALTYEAAGQPEQALAAWRTVKADLGGAASALGPRADVAITRLSRVRGTR
jgi:tetratricopeptide (TPR) repeat protein